MDVILYSKIAKISEDYISGKAWHPLVIDTSKLRSNYICTGTVGERISKDYQSGSVGWRSSSVTDCLAEVFECEADKKYRVTVTNGNTPATVGERDFFVVAVDYQTSFWKVAECIKKTNSSNPQDVYEITPTKSGHVYLNLDANFQSISIDVEVDVHTSIAVDQRSRDEIDEISEDYGTAYQWNPVEIDSTGVKENYRCAGSAGDTVANVPTGSNGMTSSSVTDCVVNAFTCEAGKTYRLIIVNGSTPASIGQRSTVVIAQYRNSTTNKVVESFATTNSSGARDIIEFTPSYSGFVYFNLDANYQSITVDIRTETGAGKTAKDISARETIERFILNSDITPELTFESGTFDVSLDDASGEGYRSQIITGVKDCAICIKVDPTYTAKYGNGSDELVTIHGSFVYHSVKNSVRIWVSDTATNSGLEVRIYKEKGHRGIYDVIVAASNSSAMDKEIADIVCDGTNDEVDLQFAVNWNTCRKNIDTRRDSTNVLLLPGSYNIDAFEQKETLHGDSTTAQYAVMVGNDQFSGNNGYNCSVAIHGPTRHTHMGHGPVVKINVTNAALSTLSNNLENVLIGVCRAGTRSGGGIHSNALSIEVKNLAIFTNGIDNRIVALDGYTAGASIFEDNDIYSTMATSELNPTQIAGMSMGSIGIRAGDGSDYGVRQFIKGNRIAGYYEGISIVGEHFIVQDNLEFKCHYGFTLNMYDHNGAVWHPNIFIGNSVEQCYKMGRLGQYVTIGTLIYIGGSVENEILYTGGEEVAMLPIEVDYESRYRGRFESDSLASPYDSSMFETGKGSGFVQTIYPW